VTDPQRETQGASQPGRDAHTEKQASRAQDQQSSQPVESEPQTTGPLPTGDGAEIGPDREEDIWIGRTSWKHFAGRLLLWLLANVVIAVIVIWVVRNSESFTGGGAFWTIAIVFLISGAIVIGHMFVRIISQRYRVTTQRLFIEKGILSQTIDQTELIRVDDVRIRKSLADRLLGLGTVAVKSTDASHAEVLIEGIDDPEKVAESIRTRMRTMRRKSLFVENL